MPKIINGVFFSSHVFKCVKFLSVGIQARLWASGRWDVSTPSFGSHLNTVDGKGGLSNNFSVIFPSFVHLLATKPMAKQSRASGTLSEGHWVEYRADFLLFFLQIFKIHQIFRQFYFS